MMKDFKQQVTQIVFFTYYNTSTSPLWRNGIALPAFITKIM